MMLKMQPSDFLVSEILFLTHSNQMQHEYYKLKKSGYSTFDAVNEIARFFCIDLSHIAYAGLKDEDGITEQYVSVAMPFSAEKMEEFNQQYAQSQVSFLKLIPTHSQGDPLKIGSLLGNSFRIILRNLGKELLDLQTNQRLSFSFINYYGPQRFGVPSSQKTTHVIGEKLLAARFDDALYLLAEQKSQAGEEAKIALSESSSGTDYFNRHADKKLIAFYKSAYHSYAWNEKIKGLLQGENVLYDICHRDGIEYFFTSGLPPQVLPAYLEHTRVRYQRGAYQEEIVERQTNVQLNALIHGVFDDIYHEGRVACDVSFFLPSGVYATVALEQLIHQLQARQKENA